MYKIYLQSSKYHGQNAVAIALLTPAELQDPMHAESCLTSRNFKTYNEAFLFLLSLDLTTVRNFHLRELIVRYLESKRELGPLTNALDDASVKPIPVEWMSDIAVE